MFLISILTFFSYFDVVKAEEIKTSVEGKSIKISISFDSSLTGLEGELNFDDDFFENVDKTDFVVAEDNLFYFNKNNNHFVLLSSYNAPLTLNVTLYLKENAEYDFTYVDFINLIGSDGKEDIELKDKHIQVINSKTGLRINGTSERNSQNEKDYIYVGFNIYTIVAIAVGFFLIIAFSYFAFSKNSFINKILINGIISLLFIFVIFYIYSLYNNKEDVDNNGVVNQKDLNIIADTLLGKVTVGKKSLKYYNQDINNDGYITITDVSSIMPIIDNSVFLENFVINENYVPKDSTFTVTFSVSSKQKVKYIYINDKKYEVEETENGYKAIINSGSSAGKKDVTVEGLELENGKKIDLTYSDNIEVLKDEPDLKSFKLNKDKKQFTIELKDKDSAITNKYVVIEDIDGNIVEEINLSDKKTYKYKTGTAYKFILICDYDLDSKVDTNNKYSKTIDLEEISGETPPSKDVYYNDITLVNIDRENKVIEFQIDANYEIKSATINGKKYTVSNNIIKVTYKKEEKTTYKIESISTDSKEIKVNKEFTLFKEEPKVNSLSVDIDNQKANVQIKIVDKDSTLTGINAILKDSKGNILETVKLDKTTTKFSFETNISDDTLYVVEIVGTFDCQNGMNTESKVLKSVEINHKSNLYIEGGKVSNINPTKGSIIDVTFKVKDKEAKDIKYFVINDKKYNVESIGNDYFKIKYQVPDEDGVNAIKIQKIVYDNYEMVVNYNDIKVDVLKDKPSIEEFEAIDDLDSESIMFKFNVKDLDNSFVKGKICLGNECQEFNKSGLNTILFPVEKNRLSKVNIDIDYDLDTNTLSQNKNVSKITLEKQVAVVDNFQFEIYNIETYKVSGSKSTYFNKNEQIKVKFNSKNVTPLYPVAIELQDKDNTKATLTYEVKKDKDGYYFIINGLSEACEKEYVIKSITLNSGKTITSEKFRTIDVKNIKFEVLKTAPRIDNVSITNNDGVLNVTFNVTDSDNALLDSEITITSNDRVYLNETIKAGNNSYKANVGTNGTYQVKIEKNYDLDNDKLNDLNEIKKIDYNREIKLDNEVKFSIKSLKITEYVKNGSNAIIEFQNEYVENDDVTAVIIDGTSYNVTKNNGGYIVKYVPNKVGVNNLTLEKVVIGEKEFSVNKKLSFISQYETPSANYKNETTVDKERNTTKATFNIIDKDNTIEKLTAYLKNSNNEILESNVIDKTSTSVTFDLPSKHKHYIELVADYTLYDDKKFTTTLFVAHSRENNEFEIISSKVVSDGTEKNSSLKVQYEVNTNISEELNYFVINGKAYRVEKVQDGDYRTYEAVVNTPNSTTFKLKLSEALFENEKIEVNNTIEMTVLKDKPEITNFSIDVRDKKVKFNLVDNDKTVTKQFKVKVTDEENNSNTYNISLKESNKYSLDYSKLNLKKDKFYTIEIIATYSLTKKDSKEETLYETKIFTGESTIETVDIVFNKLVYAFLKDESNIVDINIPSLYNLKDTLKCVVIDGINYEVTYKSTNNGYDIFTFNYVPNSKKSSFKISEGILKDGSRIMINQSTSYKLFNKIPDTFITSIKENNDELSINYYVLKNDNIKDKKIKIVVKDSNNVLINEKEVSINNSNTKIKLNGKKSKTYNIEIYASFNYQNNKTYDDILLYQEQFNSEYNAQVLESTLSSENVYANDTLTITYIFANDNNKIPARLVVNGKEYICKNKTIDSCEIDYPVKGKQKIEYITLSKVIYSNGLSESVYYVDKVEIVNKLPNIEDYKLTDSYSKKEVTIEITLEDDDNYLKEENVYISLGNQKQKLKAGKNKIKFKDIKEDELLNILIYSNTSSGKVTILEKPYIMRKDYGLSIENVIFLDKDNREKTTFSINEDITLKFESYNTTILYPISITINGKSYELSKDNNTYTVKIEGFAGSGSKIIKIEKITLNSGKTISIDNKVLSLTVK